MALNTSEVALLEDMETDQTYDPAKSVQEEIGRREEPVSNLYVPQEGVEVADSSRFFKDPETGEVTNYPYTALTEQMQPAIDIKEERRVERENIQLQQDLVRAEKPQAQIDFFGSFTSEADFSLYDFDVDTNTYSNARIRIDPNNNITGYDTMKDRVVAVPDGLTKEEILDFKDRVDRNVLTSGDLTYRPQSDEKIDGSLPKIFGFGDGLMSVEIAERTVLPQGLRAFASLVPVTAGWRVSTLTKKLLPKGGGAKGSVIRGAAILGSFALATYGSYEGVNKILTETVGSDFDVYGWGQFLFKMQEAEIQAKGLDPSKVRTLSAEQYAQLIDPTFAPYWTKFANTLTENLVGTVTFMSSAGFSMINRARVGAQGQLDISILGKFSISGSRNAYLKDIHGAAMKNIKIINQERAKSKLKALPITKERVLNEVRLVVKDRKQQARKEIRGAVSRMIYGFRETQLADQLLNRKLFWAEIALAEGGAATAVSLASYYQFANTSPRTEDLDKLPFLVLGAIGGQFSTPLMTNPISPVNWVVSGTGAVSKLFNLNNVKGTTDFLTGKIDSLPENLSNEQRKGLIDLKKKIGVMDQELAGEITRSIQTGIELTDNAIRISERVARETGDSSLIINRDELISAFTGLETVAALESFLMKEVMNGRSTSEAMSAATEKLLTTRKAARQRGDAVLRKLLLIGQKSGVMDDSQYMAVRTALENSMLKTEEEAATQFNMVMNDLLNYEAYEALSGIVENPMKGQKRVQQMIDFVQTKEGANFKFNINNKLYQGKEAAKQLNLMAIKEINAVHETAVTKTIAAKVAAAKDKGKSNEFIGEAPNQQRDINPQIILEESSKKYTRLLMNRIDNSKETSERLYREAWQGSENYKINITDLYTEMYDDVAGNIDSATDAGVAIPAIKKLFDTSTREGMRKYITNLGDGDYSAGYKIILDNIKAKKLQGKLTVNDLSSPTKFAKAMTDEKNGDDIQALLGQEFRLEILTPDLERGLKNLKEAAGILSRKAPAGKLGSKGYGELTEYEQIVSRVDATVKNAMSDLNLDQMLLVQANDYWKKNILAMRNTKLWRETMGKIINNDFAEDTITGYVHEADPLTWAGKFWNDISDQESASQAWREFGILFPKGKPGSVEEKLRESAIDALDQAALSKGIYGLELKTDALPLERVDISGMAAKEDAPQVLVPKVTAIGRTELDLEDSIGINNATSNMKEKVEWMRQASKNEYFAGSHDLYGKVGTAIKYSKQAREEVNWSLKQLHNAYKDKQSLVKAGYLEKRKKGKQIIMQKLQQPYDATKKISPGALMQNLLENPENMDAVIKALTDEFGNEQSARFFLRGVFAKGVNDLAEAGIAATKTAKAGITGVGATYDPMQLVKLMEDNEDVMKSIFGAEHYQDMVDFSRFMVRFMPEPNPQAVDKLGYAAAGTFKKSPRFNLSHASIISRVYAAESGRTSFRYIGAEAVLGVLMNSDNDVLGAIFLDPELAGKVVDFLIDPTTSIRDTKGNIVSWVHNLTGLSQALGEVIVEVGDTFADGERTPVIGGMGTQMQRIYGEGFVQPKVSELKPGRRASTLQEMDEDDAYNQLQKKYKRYITKDIGIVVNEAATAVKDRLFEEDLQMIIDMQQN